MADKLNQSRIFEFVADKLSQSRDFVFMAVKLNQSRNFEFVADRLKQSRSFNNFFYYIYPHPIRWYWYCINKLFQNPFRTL